MNRFQGFSLIELIVTLSVAAILIAVAVPNLSTVVQNSRISAQANDLLGDLNFARSEAIKRRSNVGICKSTNGTACAGGGEWRDGRAVYVGSGANGAWVANDPILRFREPLAITNDTLIVSLADPIIFSASGSFDVDGFFFVFCDNRGFSQGKQVNLNRMGQAVVRATPPVACS